MKFFFKIDSYLLVLILPDALKWESSKVPFPFSLSPPVPHVSSIPSTEMETAWEYIGVLLMKAGNSCEIHSYPNWIQCTL